MAGFLRFYLTDEYDPIAEEYIGHWTIVEYNPDDDGSAVQYTATCEILGGDPHPFLPLPDIVPPLMQRSTWGRPCGAGLPNTGENGIITVPDGTVRIAVGIPCLNGTVTVWTFGVGPYSTTFPSGIDDNYPAGGYPPTAWGCPEPVGTIAYGLYPNSSGGYTLVKLIAVEEGLWSGDPEDPTAEPAVIVWKMSGTGVTAGTYEWMGHSTSSTIPGYYTSNAYTGNLPTVLFDPTTHFLNTTEAWVTDTVIHFPMDAQNRIPRVIHPAGGLSAAEIYMPGTQFDDWSIPPIHGIIYTPGDTTAIWVKTGDQVPAQCARPITRVELPVTYLTTQCRGAVGTVVSSDTLTYPNIVTAAFDHEFITTKQLDYSAGNWSHRVTYSLVDFPDQGSDDPYPLVLITDAFEHKVYQVNYNITVRHNDTQYPADNYETTTPQQTTYTIDIVGTDAEGNCGSYAPTEYKYPVIMAECVYGRCGVPYDSITAISTETTSANLYIPPRLIAGPPNYFDLYVEFTGLSSAIGDYLNNPLNIKVTTDEDYSPLLGVYPYPVEDKEILVVLYGWAGDETYPTKLFYSVGGVWVEEISDTYTAVSMGLCPDIEGAFGFSSGRPTVSQLNSIHSGNKVYHLPVPVDNILEIYLGGTIYNQGSAYRACLNTNAVNAADKAIVAASDIVQLKYGTPGASLTSDQFPTTLYADKLLIAVHYGQTNPSEPVNIELWLSIEDQARQGCWTWRLLPYTVEDISKRPNNPGARQSWLNTGCAPAHEIGEWTCPGNGQSAVWVGDLPTVGSPPDCTGEWECPGDGAPAKWIGDVDQYGNPPSCIGDWECPGDGLDAVWIGDVPPYTIPPNCTGQWECSGEGEDFIWSNPAIAPYGDDPTIKLSMVEFVEFKDEDVPDDSIDWVNGSRMDGVINEPHNTVLDIPGCSLSIARDYTGHAEVSCVLTDIKFPRGMKITNLVLEHSDDSTDGLDGEWITVGDESPLDGRTPRRVENAMLQCMDPSDCIPDDTCICDDLVLPTMPYPGYVSPITVTMDNERHCPITVVLNTSSNPSDTGSSIGTTTIMTTGGETRVTVTLSVEFVTAWLHFYCDGAYVGYRNIVISPP